MAKLKDFYGLLGVAPTSEDFVIQAAYKAMLKRYHPDVNKNADAADKTIKITEAYNVLGDPEKRARYDRALKASRAKANAGKADSQHTKDENKGDNSPPPEPPNPATSQEIVIEPAPSSDRAVFWVSGGLVVLAIMLATFLPKSTSAPDDEMSVESYVNDIAGDGLTNETAGQSLATETMPNVDFKNIEDAAKAYARVAMASGPVGARKFSERCHKDALETPTWQAFDYCAAFDYAAAHIDEDTTSDSDMAKSSYFQFQIDNMERFYSSGGAAATNLYARLPELKKYAAQAADEAVQAEATKAQEAEQRANEKAAREAIDNALNATNVVEPPPSSTPETSELDRIFSSQN